MSITVPFHQFEIRFSKLLDFASAVKEIVAPFVPMALDVQLENENSINCKCRLIFSEYHLYISWDRLIIKYDGDLSSLRENNSIVEQPFFNLLGRIENTKGFGEISNCLIVSLFIEHFGDLKESDIVENFTDKYFKMENLDELFSNPSDACLILEKRVEDKQINIQYGPYLGIEDIRKRIEMPRNQDVINQLDKIGEMLEVKIFETKSAVTFKDYKQYLDMTLNYAMKIWPTIL